MNRLSLRLAWTVFLIAALAGAWHGVLIGQGSGGATARTLQSALHLLSALAYAFATPVCFRIARDYGSGSTMKLAWRLIGISAGTATLRHGFEWLVLATGWIETLLTTMVSLRQIPVAISLLLLTAGLLAMWSSFTAIGMGLRFRAIDVVALLVILVAVPSAWYQRQEMVDARSVFPLVRQLQSFSPLLLAGPALISVVLHRISQELGGGQFAVSLRCLVVFLLMRLVSLFLGLYGGVPGFTVAARIAWWSAASMFLLAVLYRWRVTVSAGQLAQRYELNAQAELADVSRMLCLPSRK